MIAPKNERDPAPSAWSDVGEVGEAIGDWLKSEFGEELLGGGRIGVEVDRDRLM